MSKFTEQITNSQRLPAGVHPKDSNIEFVGVKTTKKVLCLQNGKTYPFVELSAQTYNLLKQAYLKAPKAVKSLSALTKNVQRQVELFTYFMYGDLDTTADVVNGVLQPSENFRDTQDCISLQWDCKNIDYNGVPLKPIQILILDLIAQDLPDKAIASKIGICLSTLDYHKKQLYVLLNSTNKTSAMLTAVKAKIIKA